MRVLFYTAAAMAASIASIAQAVKLDCDSEVATYYGADYSQLHSYEEKKDEKKSSPVASKQDVQRKNDEDLIMKAMNVAKQPAPAKSGTESALEKVKQERAAEKKKELAEEMEAEKLKKQRDSAAASAAKE